MTDALIRALTEILLARPRLWRRRTSKILAFQTAAGMQIASFIWDTSPSAWWTLFLRRVNDELELMPLEETEIIDQIIPPNEEQRVGLVITDSGAVNDPWLRLDLLKKKFNYYVERAMDGGVHPRYRYADPNDFYIEVVCARPPTEEMLQISEVAPEGDTRHRLRVLYRELREGIWTETSVPEPIVPLENIATDSLDAIIAAAFDAGHDSLRAGGAPLLLLFVKNTQAFLQPIRDLHSDQQVTSALATWAAENQDVSTCVLLRFSRRRINARTTNVLVARVLQAQAREGFILAQELLEDNGLYYGSGELLFLGCCENPLITR